MDYSFIPSALFGVLLLVVGSRLDGNSQVYSLAKLGLIFGGLILIGWSLFSGFNELLPNE